MNPIPVKVYIVERCYDYEGCSIAKVFADEADADAYADAEDKSFGYTTNGPHRVTEWLVTTSVPPTSEKP